MDAAIRKRESVLSERTLVLNRAWIPVHVTTVRHALVMLFHRSALAVCPQTYETRDFASWVKSPVPEHGRTVRTVRYEIPAPEVILLSTYDRLPRTSVPFSRRNLCRRDQQRCQYCGRRQAADSLTIDHIIPRSQGGSTNWLNCVLACPACNRKKGGRTPDQAGMRLITAPVRPDWSLVVGHEAGGVSKNVFERLGARKPALAE